MKSSSTVSRPLGNRLNPALGFRVWWVVASVGCLSVLAPNSGAQGLQRGPSSLAFGAPSAPARQHQGGFEIVRRDRLSAEPESSLSEPLKDPEELEEEAYPGWRGYLYEKGPARVVVEAEEQQEIQPLDDSIWKLIMGKPASPEVFAAAPSRHSEVSGAGPSSIPVPKQQIGDATQVEADPQSEEAIRLQQEEGEAQSVIVEDTADSYRQLMELFTQPVFVTPTRELDGIEGRVSFRVPEMETRSPTIRQGSRARFEIRRQ